MLLPPESIYGVFGLTKDVDVVLSPAVGNSFHKVVTRLADVADFDEQVSLGLCLFSRGLLPYTTDG